MGRPQMQFSYPAYALNQQPSLQTRPVIRNRLGQEKNGHYLLGQKGHWHGGVHITNTSHPNHQTEPVRALADGEIVAYRMLEEDSLSPFNGQDFHYSSNFCLLRHEYPLPDTDGTFVFYSLYMHLKALGQHSTSPVHDACPWLESITPGSVQQPQPGIAIKAGDPLGYLGHFQLPSNLQADLDERWQLHLEVFSTEQPPASLFNEADGWVFLDNESDSPFQFPDQNTEFLQQLLAHLGETQTERTSPAQITQIHAQAHESGQLEKIIVHHPSEWHSAWDGVYQKWIAKIQGKVKAWVRDAKHSDEKQRRQADYELNGEHFAMNRERMRQMAFMHTLGLPEKVWHLHPFAVATHLNLQARFAPPILLNLRNDAPEEAPERLSQAQLDYFKENGNNALVFVHGYSVPLGEFGKEQVPSAIPRRVVGHDLSRFKKEILPYPYEDLPNKVYRPLEEAPSSHHPFNEDQINGTGARGWLLNMEYQLNRAAGYQGHDQENEQPYQRILGIAWEGDVGMTNFYGSTLNALIAGRRLAPILRQLAEAGIQINLMSHSLGARVLLTAMNILAETHQKAIDHVFLWQPAVPDNALSNQTEHDTHPFGAGVFPQAHKATKQVVVLHSKQDGILDGHTGWDDLFRDLHSGNITEAGTGFVGGAYLKKWWDISLIGAGVKTVLDDLYVDYDALHISELDSGVRPDTRPPQDPESLRRFQEQIQQTRERNQAQVDANWERLEKDLKLEMKRKRYVRSSPSKVPEYRLLAPIAINRILDEQDVDHYIQRLRAYYNGEHRESPRPALGYRGLADIREEDDFIRGMLDETGEFAEVDQTPWLFDHSGMRIPSEELFKKVYVDEIWRRLKDDSKFGLYE